MTMLSTWINFVLQTLFLAPVAKW